MIPGNWIPITQEKFASIIALDKNYGWFDQRPDMYEKYGQPYGGGKESNFKVWVFHGTMTQCLCKHQTVYLGDTWGHSDYYLKNFLVNP